LKAVSQTILMNIKPTDTVGRYGGDELVVILQDVTKSKLKKIAEKLWRHIKSSEVTARVKRYRSQPPLEAQ
jgi:diguanylate cyclase (GGDEF)-like protein